MKLQGIIARVKYCSDEDVLLARLEHIQSLSPLTEIRALRPLSKDKILAIRNIDLWELGKGSKTRLEYLQRVEKALLEQNITEDDVIIACADSMVKLRKTI